ncbi:MAG: hypothetical protein PWQ79_359 [Thermococcaceae archaeon]|nr:hypothetical protein [Thermococcaceae archaeon]
MLVKEIIKTVEIIPDPYVRAVTYAKIGERLAKARDKSYKTAFLKAMESAKAIEDPVKTLRALLSVGYSMGRAGLKSSKRIYSQVLEDSRLLPQPQRDVLMRLASSYMLGLGEVGEAITYALEISDQELRDETLLTIIRFNTRRIERESIKVAYRLRRSKMALEYMEKEPYRSRAVLEIIKSHIALGSYETAVYYLNLITEPEWAKQAFKEVLFLLRDKGVLDHLLDSLESVAETFVERFGEGFIPELALSFALAGKGAEAVRLLRRLESIEEMKRIAMQLLELDGSVVGEFVSALNEEEAAVVGKALMNAILENPKLGSDEIVNAIGSSTQSEEVWVKVARYYSLRGDLALVRKIARVIKTPELRSVVMADIAHRLLKEGKVEEAIDAALEVRDKKFSSIIVAEILINALEMELKEEVRTWSASESS